MLFGEVGGRRTVAIPNPVARALRAENSARSAAAARQKPQQQVKKRDRCSRSAALLRKMISLQHLDKVQVVNEIAKYAADPPCSALQEAQEQSGEPSASIPRLSKDRGGSF
jgi:hypothetical protein